MNILVLLKQTFDTEEKISIQNGQIEEDGREFIINPYDEYAVEEAIKLKEEHGGEVTVITVGPDRSETALRTAMAMGVDKGILVDDEALVSDEYTISKVLSTIIKDRAYDIILTGNMSVDNGAGQVGIRLAEELGITPLSTVVKLTIEDEKVTVVRDVEGDSEIIETQLPLLITAQQGLNEPRYPSLPGIMKAKKKPIERIDGDDLEISLAEIQAKSIIIDQFMPKAKDAGRILTGDPANQVKELVQVLQNEAKVL
ncbi:electron transfer flavoprotein subunit beta/FixA family protein [Neobacillus sp. OS1-33]|uniref:electron transfer flavoprotein subunit beta/FixA family protein n=1 Tax=Neobacillus sp. OS1-33 TaxID=3070683 RepID=UPI0027E06EEE|nr:electron transfer flavoprotein subunit beta/FixA family protein [Neobacillus sp. OS1-33]WML24967.1 electron transfer flavoprotein subunit beta/FixA family protein [Neobacillus sp. OS1-33]